MKKSPKCFEYLISKFFVIANIIDTSINYQLIELQKTMKSQNSSNLCNL